MFIYIYIYKRGKQKKKKEKKNIAFNEIIGYNGDIKLKTKYM